MITPLVKFKTITKDFKNIRALNSVNLSIPENSIFGILGPNGSGKSTLMRILAGLIRSWSGEIETMGNNYNSLNNQYIHQFGFLIESPSFYEHLSAIDNLKIFSRLTNDSKMVESVLDTVKLTERGSDKVKTYSYGMKQRLGLAQCLLHDPKILIIDELNNGLDPSGIREMSKIINDLHKRGKTVCISTHILSEVDALCTHAAVLKNGNLISTVELDHNYHAKQTFIIRSDNIHKYEQKLQSMGLFNIKFINQDSLLIQSSKLDDITLLKKVVSKSKTHVSLSEQSNLMEYFND